MDVRSLLPLLRNQETPQTEVHDFTAQTVHFDVVGAYFAFLRTGYFSAHRKQSTSATKHQNARATSALSTASTGDRLFDLVVMDNCNYIDATLIRSSPQQSSTSSSTPQRSPTTPPTPQQPPTTPSAAQQSNMMDGICNRFSSLLAGAAYNLKTGGGGGNDGAEGKRGLRDILSGQQPKRPRTKASNSSRGSVHSGDGDGGGGGNGGREGASIGQRSNEIAQLIFKAVTSIDAMPNLIVGEAVVREEARREMAHEVPKTFRQHKTKGLIYNSWTLDQSLPDSARIKFCPQASFGDDFMLFSEEALVETLWPSKEGRPPKHGTKQQGPIRVAMDSFMQQSNAKHLVQTDYGALIQQMFFVGLLPWHPGLSKYYVPSNMIRINGLEFQVLAFDLRKSRLPPSRYKMDETQVNIEDIELKFPSVLATRSVFGRRNVKAVRIDVERSILQRYVV
ncbi:hypothetical protein BGZ58_010807 [Dissophora ornata]|nr:hypothetical protein BGZ58_010807 [Dissophora ornata]